MKEIIEKIKALGFDEYAVCREDDKVYLLVYMGYGYYRETSPDSFTVSPYYFASNRAYFAAKELAEYIGGTGCRAEVKNHIIYDTLLEKCGGIRGDNNLFFTDGLGSLFCVHVIETDAALDERILKGKKCTHCGRCKAACPMGALDGGGIKAGLCLRDRMADVNDELCRDKITTLLGCDCCQRVCPNNACETDERTYAEFGKDKILKGDMTGLTELVGKNMARKRRLQFQAMCIAANTGDRDRENVIRGIKEEALDKTKNWCLECLKNVDLSK